MMVNFKITKRTVKERRHRLPRECYKGKIACVFTACISDRRKIFSSEEIFRSVERILLDCLKKEHCEAHVYLFMPDHCHFVIQGKSDDSDLWQFMVNFKQRTGYWLSQNRFSAKWQKDFYDHILRKDEDLKKQIRYILENPLRRNLVSDWRGYSYKGSTLYDLKECMVS